MDNKYFMDNIVYCNSKRKKIQFYMITVSMCLAIFLSYLFLDRLFPYSQILGEIIIMAVGVWLLGRFYKKREVYIEKYERSKAYNKAFFRFHVTTMPFIYMSALHPLYAVNNQGRIIPWFISLIVGIYFIGSALFLHRKSIKIFGMDNLFMYYVYFPEKSSKTESEIHSMLRHPIYSAMARISVGLGLCMGTRDSILLGIVLPVFQWIWLRVYEEKELKERFGNEYKQYIKDTNAIWNKPQNLGKFWKFIFKPVS